MIRAHHLQKSYGEHLAVDDVSLVANPGEILGLLGPNGAGKSTTISMLVGLLTPDSGHVELGGESDPTRPHLRSRLGLSPQDLSLYESLDARENLDFFGRLHGLRGRALADRVAWCLEFAGLRDRAKDRANTYSGGMKRRLNLAIALVHDPEVILFDEPTVGVDPQSREHLFTCIESLRSEGRTILYTTHYMEEAQRLCDHVLIVDAGRVLAKGTVKELIAAHGGLVQIECESVGDIPEGTAIPGEHDGRFLRFQGDAATSELAACIAAGVELRNVRTIHPDLNDVFLSLTGRELRDQGS